MQAKEAKTASVANFILYEKVCGDDAGMARVDEDSKSNRPCFYTIVDLEGLNFDNPEFQREFGAPERLYRICERS